jgi:Rrf2 family protein
MKLSMAAELAVRGILCLAEEYGHGPLPLDKICRRRKLRKEYLTKIFGLLARANLVDAVRGKGGGYALSRPPAKISLLEVIEAIEGPLALNLCQHTPPKCEEPDCRVRPVWTDLQETFRSALASKTLDQLIEEAPDREM